MKKSNKKVLWITLPILLILLVSALGVYYYGSTSQSALGITLEQVYKQNWGHIRCVQNFDYDIIYTRYIDDISTQKCNDYTNECLIQIVRDRDSSILSPSAIGYYQICNLDGSNCGGSVKIISTGKSDIISFTIPVGKQVMFSSGGVLLGNYDQLISTKKAKTFYIEGEENGKIFTSQTCILSAELRHLVLSSGLNELSFSGANQYQNYLLDWVLTATQTATYNGNKVVCQAKQLYSTEILTFKDGTSALFQKDPIKSVECCPQEANCDPITFTFKPDVVKDCPISVSQCPNGGNPIALTGNTYMNYICSNGVCTKSQDYTTECTNNAICIASKGTNYICDLSLNNWGKCIVKTTPDYCGDRKCDSLIGETKLSCPDDCGTFNCTETPNNPNCLTGECGSCTQWALNIFKSSDKDCTAKSVVQAEYTSFWSYINPVNWGKSAVDATGLTNQNIICPILIVLGTILVIIVLFVLMIILLGFAGVALLFKRLFKGKRR